MRHPVLEGEVLFEWGSHGPGPGYIVTQVNRSGLRDDKIGRVLDESSQRQRWWLILCASSLVVGCSEKQSQVSTATTAPGSSPPQPGTAAPGKAVGTAKLESDGTLVLTLYTQGSMRGQTQRRYAEDDPKREDILKHIGGLEPGEEKLVPPWPDDIDDARVQAAVKKHIAKESWADAARITITGTDREGRIAVTAVDPKPPHQGLSLRLDPKSYAIVVESPMDK